jgi:hypothetical protein
MSIVTANDIDTIFNDMHPNEKEQLATLIRAAWQANGPENKPKEKKAYYKKLPMIKALKIEPKKYTIISFSLQRRRKRSTRARNRTTGCPQ